MATHVGGRKVEGRIHLAILSAIALTRANLQTRKFAVAAAGSILQRTLSNLNLSSTTVESDDPIPCHAWPLHKFVVSLFSPRACLGGRFPECRDRGCSCAKLNLKSRRPMVIARLVFSFINC